MSAVQINPKRVLVIGGGPTGLATLRNLTERGNFERVELVERRDDVGGVWYLDDDPDNSSQAGSGPRWPSPAYPGLIGNVLPEFLSFSEFPFPERSSKDQPFPTLIETHEYLRAFARPYLNAGVIRLNTEIVSVEELEEGAGWRVFSTDWARGADGKQQVENWDAVVVSIGWYDNPVWPHAPGLDELRAKNLAKHAKWWRGPSEYCGKRVLVVGNANSSNDMAAQLAPVALEPVYQSIRRAAFPGFPSLPDNRIAMVAPVAKYTLKSNPGGDKFDVLLTDGSEIKDLDFVHFGTGYKPIPHIIRVLRGSKGSSTMVSLDTLLESDAQPRVPSLHRYILYAQNPSLAFIGAALAYTPFTIADVASTWLALAWSGSVSYPDTPNGRLVFESKRLEAVNTWRSKVEHPSSLMVYSVLGMYEQEYASGLKEDIVKVKPEWADILPEWNDERTTIREAMFKTKLAALRAINRCDS